jgi:dUTP pyrophosphatase|tara:strand:+ start:2500 stop:3006 length:507 start_codon:yes stop_codon:yes gene_type:complete
MLVAILFVLLCVLAFLILLERKGRLSIAVEIQLLSDHAKVPKYKTTGAACADIYANLHQSIVLEPHSIAKIPTGFKLNIPSGFEVLLRPRSGLSLNGISLANCIGTIDSDYNKEVMVLLSNHSNEPFTIENGMRVAQMGIKQVYQLDFKVVEKLAEITERGGFGSTGL